MANSTNIIGFGDVNLFNKLFQKLNSQFSTNETYANKPNQISISGKTNQATNLFEMKITTKYYDLDLDLEILSLDMLEEKVGDNKVGAHGLEGIFFLLTQESDVHRLNTVQCEQFLNDNQNCLSVLITDESSQIDQESVKHFLNKYEHFVPIELELMKETTVLSGEENDDSDESSFTDLDELINLVFVQSWSNMRLKNGKAAQASMPDTTSILENDVQTNDVKVVEKPLLTNLQDDACENRENEDDEFNFENLIMNLNEMRSKAENLSFDERKKYAENVVKNFWKSMGGDDSEIADLDED